MDTHLAIVRKLADGRFHSGEALAHALGISRTAVWKAVRKAAAHLGLEVESARGRGYRLRRGLELLDAERILAAIPRESRHWLNRLEIHDEIDSTNSRLMREGHAGASAGVLCLAERQTAGRGRRGRTWVSPYGSNLYLSLLWRYPFGPGQLGGLSLAAGTAVAGVLESAGAREIALKWPNDVLWRRRKLAGLLIEVVGETQGPSLVVAGLGLNLYLASGQAAAIDQPWTDLETLLGAVGFSRNHLAGRLADGLIRALELYGREGLAPFLPAWQRFDAFRGEPVEVRLGDQVTPGVHAGVTLTGALRLEVEGAVETFQAGEVSLRPVPPK